MEGELRMKGTITIKANIPEDIFMESMLNQYYSGYNISLIFLIYAMARSWNTNKLFYYMKLLEMKK